jgi:hypothetical protein
MTIADGGSFAILTEKRDEMWRRHIRHLPLVFANSWHHSGKSSRIES